MTSTKLKDAARADSYTAVNDHNQYGLHPLALEEDTLPPKFRGYHPGRIINDELMEGYFDEFIPVAHDVSGGRILKKKVEYKTTYCDECDEKIPARKNDRGESQCPECGLICRTSGNSAEIIIDEKAAHRNSGNQSNY